MPKKITLNNFYTWYTVRITHPHSKEDDVLRWFLDTLQKNHSPDTHDDSIRHLFVRETSKKEKEHYHICFFTNINERFIRETLTNRFKGNYALAPKDEQRIYKEQLPYLLKEKHQKGLDPIVQFYLPGTDLQELYRYSKINDIPKFQKDLKELKEIFMTHKEISTEYSLFDIPTIPIKWHKHDKVLPYDDKYKIYLIINYYFEKGKLVPSEYRIQQLLETLRIMCSSNKKNKMYVMASEIENRFDQHKRKYQ